MPPVAFASALEKNEKSVQCHIPFTKQQGKIKNSRKQMEEIVFFQNRNGSLKIVGFLVAFPMPTKKGAPF